MGILDLFGVNLMKNIDREPNFAPLILQKHQGIFTLGMIFTYVTLGSGVFVAHYWMLSMNNAKWGIGIVLVIQE